MNRTVYGEKQKISVGGYSVWTGAKSVFDLPADRRLERGLCMAEEPNNSTGAAAQTERDAAGSGERTQQKTGDPASRIARSGISEAKDKGSQPGAG